MQQTVCPLQKHATLRIIIHVILSTAFIAIDLEVDVYTPKVKAPSQVFPPLWNKRKQEMSNLEGETMTQDAHHYTQQ